MQVVHVRHMRMPVPHPRMPVGMGVWLAGWIAGHVLVLMMRIMDVRMTVLHGLVLMFVLVVFGQVEPDAWPISRPARMSCTVIGSPRNVMAATAPRKGAVEK